MATRVAVFSLFVALRCSSAPAPLPLWSTSLGLNGTIYSSSSPLPAVFSADGASIFFVESFLAYSGAQSWSLIVAAHDAATGARKWSWTPPYAESGTGSFPNMNLVLSADGATLFVVGPTGTNSGSITAINTASGGLLWGPLVQNNLAPGSDEYLHISLPAITAAGDLCVKTASAVVTCFNASSGATRFTVEIDQGSFLGLDPTREYLFSISSSLICYGTLTGALLWQQASPADTDLLQRATELSATTLYAVGANAAQNTASLYAWAILDGSAVPGFPTLLPSSIYMDSGSMIVTPGGSLLLTRFLQSPPGTISLALLSATTGAEKWVFTPPSASLYLVAPLLSADGSLAFVPGACGSAIFPFTCRGASLSIVSLATGTLVAAAPFPDASVVVPLAVDGNTGGAVIVSYFFSQSFGMYSYLWGGVTPLGAMSWVLPPAPLPAPPTLVVAFSATARRIAYTVQPTAGADATTLLFFAELPAPAAPAAAAGGAPVAAIAGGIGGVTALVAAGAAYAHRAALFSLCGRSGGGEGAALLGA